MFRGLAGISLLLLLVQVYAAEEHMVIFNKELRTGSEFGVSVVLFDSSKQVTTILRVTKEDGELAWDGSFEEVNIALGQTSGFVSMDVPITISTFLQKYFLQVQFSENGRLTDTSYTYELTPVRLPSGIFAATDKPIYKPGDNIRYRIVVVDKEMKLLAESIYVLIEDPFGNKLINQTSGDPTSDDYTTVIENEIETYDNSALGVYKISIFAETGFSEITFKLEEYVIPKYEVTIELMESYAVQGPDAKVAGVVTAVYSFGEMVKGKLTLTANGNVIKDYNKKDMDGLMGFEIPVVADGPIYYRGFGMYDNSLSMSIEATVTDNLGMEMSDSTTFTVYRTQFAATVTDPPIYFKGSGSYSVEVKLTNPDGGPLSDWDAAMNSNWISKYKLWYRYSYGREESMDLSDQDDTSVTLTIDLTTLKEYDSFNNLEVWFEYLDDETTSGRTKVDVQTYVTTEATPLSVELTSQSETQVCFKVNPFQSGDIAYYQILDNYEGGQVLPYTSTNGHCFTVQRKHAPKTMIVVYKSNTVLPPDEKTERKDLVTAHLIVDIPWTPEQEVSVDVFPSTVEPGKNVSITFRTTGPSMVYYAGMDKGLTFLADAIEISTSKMRELVGSFRMFSREEEKVVHNPIWDGPMPMPFMEDDIMFKRRKRCFSCPGSSNYMDAETLLEDSGLGILTNLFIYKEQLDGGRPDYYMAYDGVLEMAGPVFNKNEEGVSAYRYDDDYYFVLKPETSDLIHPGAADATANSAPDDVENDSMPPAKSSKVRKDFREVWLWNMKTTPDSGVMTFSEKVPDTITSWVISAFAFNEMKGLGVAEKREVTVFKDFFLSMNLPYSVTRNEVFHLELSVFNYMSNMIQVQLDILSSNDYILMEERMKNFEIGPNSSGVAKFKIKMLTLGEPLIRATATVKKGSANIVDRVERALTVKAEGREVRHDVGFKKNMSSDAMDVDIDMARLFMDPNIVPGSVTLMFYVTGDMMGPMIKMVGGKIVMPYGCGEQNILSLTPGLFSGIYLKTINRLEKELAEKVKRVCGAGYRKEMNYKHRDGSYSAFGETANLCSCGSAGDTKGSTWLTAYVLKMFSLLYIHDITYVDFAILKEAFTYLKSISQSNCDDMYFVEMGKLIHTEMQGGSSSRFGFNAFVLISLLDFRDAAIIDGNATIIAEANLLVQEATVWLTEHIQDLIDTNNVYQLSVVAYALAKASTDSNDVADIAVELLREVQEMTGATKEDSDCFVSPGEIYDPKRCTSDSDCPRPENQWDPNYKCCKVPCEGVKYCKPFYEYRYSEKQSGSSEIETLGYTLMAAVQLYGKTTTIERQEWKDLADRTKDTLLTKQNGDGFFESTQDTAVGLEALTSYSIAFPDTFGANFAVQASAVKANEYSVTSDTVVISPNNYTIKAEKHLEVSDKPDRVRVKFLRHESGTAYITVKALYNVKTNVTDNSIDLYVKSGVTKEGNGVIEVCWKKDKNGNAVLGTMVLVGLKLPTGTAFKEIMNIEGMKDGPERFELVEQDTTVTLYYMEGKDKYSQLRCINISYTENIVVDEAEPSLVYAMDYYNKEHTAEVMYMVQDDQNPICYDCTQGSSAVQGSIGLMISLSFILLILA